MDLVTAADRIAEYLNTPQGRAMLNGPGAKLRGMVRMFRLAVQAKEWEEARQWLTLIKNANFKVGTEVLKNLSGELATAMRAAGASTEAIEVVTAAGSGGGGIGALISAIVSSPAFFYIVVALLILWVMSKFAGAEENPSGNRRKESDHGTEGEAGTASPEGKGKTHPSPGDLPGVRNPLGSLALPSGRSGHDKADRAASHGSGGAFTPNPKGDVDQLSPSRKQLKAEFDKLFSALKAAPADINPFQQLDHHLCAVKKQMRKQCPCSRQQLSQLGGDIEGRELAFTQVPPSGLPSPSGSTGGKKGPPEGGGGKPLHGPKGGGGGHPDPFSFPSRGHGVPMSPPGQGKSKNDPLPFRPKPVQGTCLWPLCLKAGGGSQTPS